MQKLEKELYIKHAKRLGAILDEKSSFIPYLKRSDFNAVIKNQLNILSACEKLFPKIDLDSKLTAKSLVKQFNKLTTEKFKIDENFKYEDQTDLIDGINYLFTFCNNMFKVNLDDLTAGKNITATDPKIDLKARPEMDQEGPKFNSNFAFAGMASAASATPYENPYLLSKAYAKLTDDMKQGKFYRFKTQPKIIPIVKWISTIATMLLVVALLLASVFGFMMEGLEVVSGETSGPIRWVMNSVFYLIVAGFGAYPLVVLMKTLVGKNAKNPNFKYYFNWGFVMIFLAMVFLFCIMDTISVWTQIDSVVTTSGVHYIGYLGVKYLLIICLSLVGVNLVPMIIGAVNNPKPDPEAIERKIREYVDLFSNEIGTNPVPPKADVQKPTDVKPSKPKEDSKKK